MSDALLLEVVRTAMLYIMEYFVLVDIIICREKLARYRIAK